MDPPSNTGDDSSRRTSLPSTPQPVRQGSSAGQHDGLGESFESTGTVRRLPEASYGTITSPTPGNNPQFAEESVFGPDRSQSRASQNLLRSPMIGAERDRPRSRRPGLPRRLSSTTAQAPHRGGVFSVDDEISEVEADAAVRQQSYSSTLRRRSHAPPPLSKLHSAHEEVEEEDNHNDGHGEMPDQPVLAEAAVQEEDHQEVDDEAGDGGDDDDGDDLSDAESFTLKDRQQAINETHPFGIRIWKPALYKKDRSVQKTAEGDIHSSPGGHVSPFLLFFNLIWTLVFGWWLALIAFVGAVLCFLFAALPSGRQYGRVLWGLSAYLFYPFGKFVRLEQQEAYLEEDHGEGRSISEYEQWQSGDLEYGRLFFGPESSRSIIGRSRRSIDSEPDETQSLLGRGSRREDHSDPDLPRTKRRLFGRGQWNIGRVIFFCFFYLLITPCLFIVSGICWFLVFWIPMGKVTMLLFDQLRRHPLALTFESDIAFARAPSTPQSSIIVCTYRAAGLKYWKYTIDGTNIFLINLMAVVLFVVFDWLVLDELLHIDNFITSPSFLFVAGLLSIIPLAYFIGQAVASISAQSSMGLGAAINAFFSTIVEVFLYCVALKQGKARLVEGSIIGSIFTGILFLPGLSMCFGAIKRKTQRFNSKSAVVTSTMLLFAVIGAFGPTLFYQIYGTHELYCQDCLDSPAQGGVRDCQRCFFSQSPSLNDRFYLEAVRPYCYIAASTLFLSYVIGLWFTLRTHAAVIWNTEAEEKKFEEHAMAQSTPRPAGAGTTADASGADIRDSRLYKRILGQSLRQVGLHSQPEEQNHQASAYTPKSSTTPHVVPPKSPGYPNNVNVVRSTVHIPGFSEAENNNLVHQVAEIAATAATMAARDVRHPRRASAQGGGAASGSTPQTARSAQPVRATVNFAEQDEVPDPSAAAAGGAAHGGGHDAPNWSRLKSSIILMSATVLYAIIAEILVDTVDVVLEGFAIDEKFLGITLFALVPNTTEFLNAISFAMNGNIALSMEIGSAYALQVCLLQIPALVFFSAVYPIVPLLPNDDMTRYIFTLLFPQWDMVTVILCVFLLSHMYGEGKSNYFKGSILLLSYLVVVVGYYLSGFETSLDSPTSPVSRFDTLGSDGQWKSHNFKTVGRGTAGAAY